MANTIRPARSCLNCALAKWDKTSTGRLHPKGGGKCGWVAPPPKAVPEAFYTFGNVKLHGGHINRAHPFYQCLTWEAAT
jgi:hypothetical protein